MFTYSSACENYLVEVYWVYFFNGCGVAVETHVNACVNLLCKSISTFVDSTETQIRCLA